MENPKDVPYIVHESDMTRLERTNKRLFMSLLISIILLFLSNTAWLYVCNQYDYASETTTYSQDGEGINVIGDQNVTETDGAKN